MSIPPNIESEKKKTIVSNSNRERQREPRNCEFVNDERTAAARVVASLNRDETNFANQHIRVLVRTSRLIQDFFAFLNGLQSKRTSCLRFNSPFQACLVAVCPVCSG